MKTRLFALSAILELIRFFTLFALGASLPEAKSQVRSFATPVSVPDSARAAATSSIRPARVVKSVQYTSTSSAHSGVTFDLATPTLIPPFTVTDTPTPTPTPPHDRRVTFSQPEIELTSRANQIIYVPGNYPTIRQALEVAQNGDTVQVDPGTYNEGSLGVPAGVNLVGAGYLNTTIDAHGNGTVILLGPDSRVEGFTIKGSGPDYFDAGLWMSQGAVTVKGNRVTGNIAGIWAWCFDPASCAIQVTAENNIIDGNTSNGINSNEYPVFQLRHNNIASNGGAGLILNNSATRAENNIVVSNGGDGLSNDAGAMARYNDFWKNSRDVFSGVGNLSLDPLFRNPSAADYRLYASSPVIGYGTAGSDMGVFPFTATGTPPNDVSLSGGGQEQWTVNWTASQAAAGYFLSYGPCTRVNTTIIDVGAVLSYELVGVSAENVGYVAVSAYDASHKESTVRLADGVKAPCPSAPTNLVVGAFPGKLIRLQWQDNSPIEDGFEIERAQVPLNPTLFSVIATVPANTTVYTDMLPILGETYWYRIRAHNTNGKSPYSNQSYNASFDTVPNLDEQYLLVLINKARAAPGAFGYAQITPVAPLAYNPLLNYAAHSHSQAILNSGFAFGHCDPAGRCPSERAHAVGYEGGVGENLIQGMTGPEWVESSNQAFMDSEGHRNNMLEPGFNEAGLGHTYDPTKGGNSDWKGQYTETFSGRSDVVIPNLPSGVVVPYHGNASTEFTYIVNYYNAMGNAPTQSLVYIDGTPYTMDLSTGNAANGTYRYRTVLASGSHAFYFYFTFSGGESRLPKRGSFNYPVVSLPPCDSKPAKPILIRPKNTGQVKKLAVRLDWNDINCVETYTAVVREGSKKGPKVQQQSNIVVSQFKTKALISGKTYYWRVTASNTIGSSKSKWWSFTVQ